MSKEPITYVKYDYISRTAEFKKMLKALGSDYDLDQYNRNRPEAEHITADRFNEGKIAWELMDFKSLEPLIEVLMFGATKYSKDNWKKGQPILHFKTEKL